MYLCYVTEKKSFSTRLSTDILYVQSEALLKDLEILKTAVMHQSLQELLWGDTMKQR